MLSNDRKNLKEKAFSIGKIKNFGFCCANLKTIKKYHALNIWFKLLKRKTQFLQLFTIHFKCKEITFYIQIFVSTDRK